MRLGTVLSMFDYTGNWALPYERAGYNVIQLDKKLNVDINDLNADWIYENILDGFETVDIVLIAPPCTCMCRSGAQYWEQKDNDGRTAADVELVYQGIRTLDVLMPEIWALENPVGRLPKLVPELGKPWYFQPYWFGDPYSKKTGLWGNFNRDLPRNEVTPVRACSEGSLLMKLGGKSEKTKEVRSATPLGFANAFFQANQLRELTDEEQEARDDWHEWWAKNSALKHVERHVQKNLVLN